MKALFNAVEMQLTREEILAMVDPKILEYIKGFNEEPYLKAFVVAGEGEATPQFDSEYKGPKVIKFTRDAVKACYDKIKAGLKVFSEHYTEDPDEFGRSEVANIVGKRLMNIGGQAKAVVVAFFNKVNESIGEMANAVSMEADLEVDYATSLVSSILGMDAIALVPEGQAPAIPSAKQIGAIRASMTTETKPNTGLDWHNLEAEFRRMKGLPSQVSDPVETIGDLDFNQDGKPILNGVDKKYAAYTARLIEKAIEMKSKSFAPELDQVKSERDEMRKKLSQYESKPKLLEAAKAAKLGEDFVKYIEARVERFKPTDDLDVSIKEFIEDKKLDYSDFVKASGKSPNLGADEKLDPIGDDITDYDDPEQNPFLKD